MTKKIVLITGGNSGEALALVKLFLQKNLYVCVLDKEISNLKNINSDNLIYFQVDISIEEDLQKISDTFSKNNYEITAMFLNAIDPIFGPAEENSIELINKVFSGAVYGTILCCSIFYKHLPENGKIVFLNSKTASSKGIANQTLHCAAKWAIKGFSESIKKACSNRKINIYNIYSGSKNTNFWTDDINSMNVSIKVPDNLINVDALAQIIYSNLFTNINEVVSDIYIERCK